MANSLLIYGATGYTGRLIVDYAKDANVAFSVAGRNEAKLRAQAADINAPYRVFDTTIPQKIDHALQGVTVLLNCAGPFLHTAKPLIQACIRNGVHYLDTAAELDSYLISADLEDEAKRQNVMLLPGCGGSVTMLGFLAVHAIEQVKDPQRIDIALHVSGPTSRGSAISARENMVITCLQRSHGVIQQVDVPDTAVFDFADSRGGVVCQQMTLPDVITLGKVTNADFIRTFVCVSRDAFSSGALDSLPDGPTAEQREHNPYSAAVMVAETDGSVTRAILRTVNGYTFTAIASVQAAVRVVAGEVKPGFHTSAGLFCSNFLEDIPQTTIKTIE